MQINANNYSIAEILDMIRRRDLLINRDYQRGSGIWPNGARSYFIDTILTGYPFPKIYFYEYIDRSDGYSAKRELVDGQQRVFSIKDFADDAFRISGDSDFAGMKFSDLPEEDQNNFLSFSVSVDVVRNATRANILQMFRRMNAYTLPLNEAEKRHSGFQGEFKWFVNELADDLNELFVEFGVFTNRQIVRMADAELITEVVLTMQQGLVSTSPSILRSIYRENDENFDERERVGGKIRAAFEFIGSNFAELKKTKMMKPYAVHILAAALIHNRYGISAVSGQMNSTPSQQFCREPALAQQQLLELAHAHEAREEDGDFRRYVWGASGGTNRISRRAARFIDIMTALGNPIGEVLDGEVAAGIPDQVA